TILSAAEIFAQIEKSLPAHIRNLADAQLDHVKSLLDHTVGSRPDVLPYALVLTMGRLAAPWQLIRLGVKAAETDDAIRIAGSSYAAAVVKWPCGPSANCSTILKLARSRCSIACARPGMASAHSFNQVDAAVGFCARVFGPDYAAVLAKAAEVAAMRR